MVFDTKWNIHSTFLAHDKYHMDLITTEEPKHKNKAHALKTSYMVLSITTIVR